MLEVATNLRIDRFSFHRLPDWVLAKRSNILGGLINMYGPAFFEFSKKPLEIKYLADSQHRFLYGHPLDDHKFSKFQILLHPDEWTKFGCSEKIIFPP